NTRLQEIPATFKFKIRRPSDNVEMRTIPVTIGDEHRIVFAQTDTSGADPGLVIADNSISKTTNLGTAYGLSGQKITGPGASYSMRVSTFYDAGASLPNSQAQILLVGGGGFGGTV